MMPSFFIDAILDRAREQKKQKYISEDYKFGNDTMGKRQVTCQVAIDVPEHSSEEYINGLQERLPEILNERIKSYKQEIKSLETALHEQAETIRNLRKVNDELSFRINNPNKVTLDYTQMGGGTKTINIQGQIDHADTVKYLQDGAIVSRKMMGYDI